MRQPAIIGFVAENANRVLHHSSLALNHYFHLRGYAQTVIDLFQPDWLDQLRQFGTDHDIEFCYGFAGIGAHLQKGGQSLWSEFRIPFLSLLYDHPFYFPDHHKVPSEYVCNCYAIEDFIEAQRNYIGSSQPCARLNIASIGYTPSRDPGLGSRDIQALFMKTGYNLATLEASFNVMPPAYRSVTWECIKMAQKNPNHMLTDLVRDCLSSLEIDYNGDQQTQSNFVYTVRVIDQYLRHWRSNQLIEGLKHLPILTHIVQSISV